MKSHRLSNPLCRYVWILLLMQLLLLLLLLLIGCVPTFRFGIGSGVMMTMVWPGTWREWRLGGIFISPPDPPVCLLTFSVQNALGGVKNYKSYDEYY